LKNILNFEEWSRYFLACGGLGIEFGVYCEVITKEGFNVFLVAERYGVGLGCISANGTWPACGGGFLVEAAYSIAPYIGILLQ
jgi:hypothetical protein